MVALDGPALMTVLMMALSADCANNFYIFVLAAILGGALYCYYKELDTRTDDESAYQERSEVRVVMVDAQRVS
jgi:hypothetical protein